MSAVEGWSSFTIEQCCDILDSKRVPVNSEDRDRHVGEIPYYGANGLQGYIDDYIFDEPLILIAEDGGCFDEFATRPIAYRVNGKSWVNNHAHVLRAKEGFYQDAIFYSLEHKDIHSFIVGGTRSKLNQSALRSIVVELPKQKAEQAKIAEILSTVDRAIEQTEALIAKQQRIKTGLMQDLLTRGIDEHGNLRTEQTHKFKDSPLGRIPVEWEVKKIGDVFDIQLGKMLSQKATEGHAPFYYLGNKNVQWDQVDASDLQMMDFDERERQKFDLKQNDILVCEGGEVGRTTIWRNEVANCYFQKAIHRLRPIDNQYFPSLFPRFMKWATRKGLLSDYTSQTSIAHLTQEKLATVPIIIQGLSEQHRLNAAADKIDDYLSSQTVLLTKLHLIKTALMQDLLTGKKRVLVSTSNIGTNI
ncbi:MAG: hypothetical protein GXY72_01100 [Deltaproteobacteria bacterium]|nr:hypothetical protein [Deltaproteobacteria bacterium]